MTTTDDTTLGHIAGPRIVAASVAKGRELLTTTDAFVAAQSPFDRQARLGLRTKVTEAMYLDYVSSQVMAWEKEELTALESIVKEIASLFSRWLFHLPDTVYLVKTTGQE